MADQLETSIDSPQVSSDNAAASSAMLTEVNNDRTAKPADTKPADDSMSSKVTEAFGSLTISDSSKDEVSASKSVAADGAADGATTAADSAPAGTKTTDGATPTADAAGPRANDGTLAAAPPAADRDDIPAPEKIQQDPRYEASAPDEKNIDTAALQKIHDDPQVKAERKKLEDEITKKEKGLDNNSDEYDRLEQMRYNMNFLELRAASEHPPLEPAQIANTYKNLNHLMDAKDGPNVQPQKDRIVAAEEALTHAADPGTIDQGNHNTCNVTTVEARMFSKDPAAATRVIDEAATRGEYTLPGGRPGDPAKTVKLDADSIKRSGPEEKDDAAQEHHRSYASQLFQVTAVNSYYKTHELHTTDEKGNAVTIPAGQVEYRQGPADNSATPPTTGEILIDKRTGKPITDGGQPVRSPGLVDDAIVDTYNGISDHPDTGFYICNKDNIAGDGNKVTKIGSEAELRAKIEEAQRAGKMPVIVRVDCNQEPFFSESGAKDAAGSAAAHVVTIRGIDKDGNLQMDNEWGRDSKHQIKVHDLYIATMKPSDAIGEVSKQCADNIKAHNADAKVPIDYGSQAELLRLRRDFGDLKGANNDDAYRYELTWLTQQAVRDAQANKNGRLDEHTEAELKTMIKGLSSEQQRKLKDDAWSGPVDGILKGGGYVGNTKDGHIKDLPDTYGTLQMASAADRLYKAGDQTFYFKQEDYNNMYSALSNKSPAEIQQMDQQFQQKHHMTMEQYIRESLKRHPAERDHALDLLHKAQNGERQAA